MADYLQFEDFKPSAKPECRHCEELLADVADETLTPGLSEQDQAFFDRHISTCADCAAALADARRGAAWLDMIKSPRPEPSAQLLERILLATSGAAGESEQTSAAEPAFLPALLPSTPAYPPHVLPFRPRVPQVAPRWNTLNRLLFEPRLAMTAAMAFFSIALTLNLAGVHLNQLHARDLGPSGLRRSYYEATASVTRRYEGLRVVHTVESRLDDLREQGPDADETPESRRDQPVLSPAEPARPLPAPPATRQTPPAKNEPKQDGAGLHAEPLLEPRSLPLADRKLSSVHISHPVSHNRQEGGLA